jgi:hypothetical protein
MWINEWFDEEIELIWDEVEAECIIYDEAIEVSCILAQELRTDNRTDENLVNNNQWIKETSWLSNLRTKE